MASKYRGPKFPIAQFKNGSVMHLLEIVHRNTTNDFYAEFEKREAEIRDKGKAGVLGPVGVKQALGKLREEFEGRITTTPLNGGDTYNDFLNKARARVKELTAALTAPPALSKDASVADQFDMVQRKWFLLNQHAALPPAERRAKIDEARTAMAHGDSRAREFLSAIYNERLLDPQTASRVEFDLMRDRDPVAFSELEQLLGASANGERDPLSSALGVTEFALQKFREFMDAQCGTNSEVEAARAGLMKQVEANPKAPITLTEQEAHDPRLYQLARQIAADNGRLLSIQGPQGVGAVEPGGTDSAGGQ
jgi:hypothetical protein